MWAEASLTRSWVSGEGSRLLERQGPRLGPWGPNASGFLKCQRWLSAWGSTSPELFLKNNEPRWLTHSPAGKEQLEAALMYGLQNQLLRSSHPPCFSPPLADFPSTCSQLLTRTQPSVGRIKMKETHKLSLLFFLGFETILEWVARDRFPFLLLYPLSGRYFDVFTKPLSFCWAHSQWARPGLSCRQA